MKEVSEMDEKSYELLSVKLCRFTNRIYVRLLETSYIYKHRGTGPEELRVVKKKIVLKLEPSAEVLESLPVSKESAVRLFCEQIAEAAGESRYPRWYKRRLIEREREEVRLKLSRERACVNARCDSIALPYKEEAKRLSLILISAYEDRSDKKKAVQKAESACMRFENKRKSLLYRLILKGYSERKHAELYAASEEAKKSIACANERISRVEGKLHAAADGILKAENRQAHELEQIAARERESELDLELRLCMLN